MAVIDIIRAKLPSSAISSKIQWFIFQYKMKAMAGSSPIRGVLVDWWAFEWFVWVPVEQRRKVGGKMQLAAFLLVRHDHHMCGEFLRRQQYSCAKTSNEANEAIRCNINNHTTYTAISHWLCCTVCTRSYRHTRLPICRCMSIIDTSENERYLGVSG